MSIGIEGLCSQLKKGIEMNFFGGIWDCFVLIGIVKPNLCRLEVFLRRFNLIGKHHNFAGGFFVFEKNQ